MTAFRYRSCAAALDWFSLWTRSVDERWEGPNAERAKSYAAALMAGLAKRVFGFVWSPALANS